MSDKFAHLDEVTLSKFELQSRRLRNPEFKGLEAALAEWQIRYDRHPDSGSTTRELLRHKAIEFWGKLPEYVGKPIPKFSNRWLNGFKKRHNMKERRRHEDGASVKIDDESERIIEEIREVGKEYGADNTYNIDESGYY